MLVAVNGRHLGVVELDPESTIQTFYPIMNQVSKTLRIYGKFRVQKTLFLHNFAHRILGCVIHEFTSRTTGLGGRET